MHILCVGISHRTAPVELRERVAMGSDGVADLLRRLHTEWPMAEIALLSTCNRTEFYVARPLHGHPRMDEVIARLALARQTDETRLAAATYHFENERAIRHAMRVACGLDSMVLGEHQVLGQVRQTYELAQQTGTVGRVLHKLFQNALAVAKQARTETGISQGRTSVSSVAVDFARHLFSHFEDKTLLVIGAGKMTDLALRHFSELCPGRVVVCNRSLEKALPLAQRFNGRAEPFERLPDLLTEADLVISSTGAERPIVTEAMFAPIVRRRKFRPIFVIDIAVPRDFEPAIGQMTNVYLYDMDDLQQAIAEQMTGRSEHAAACEAMVERESSLTYQAIQTADYAGLIQKLRQQLHEIGEAETQRTLNRLQSADAVEAKRLLDEHTQRLVNKLLHRPLSAIHRGDAVEAAMNATALRRLFNLDEPEDLHPPERTVEQ